MIQYGRKKEGRGTMMKKIQIAIDGPAGAGKSTVAKIVAEKLQFTYIDTGAMYRAVTYQAMQQHVSLNDAGALTTLAEKMKITLQPSAQGQLIFIDGQEVTQVVRTPVVTANVSQVAAHAGVRAVMVKLQQELASAGGVVMDGRDIATHVLPQAELKVYMSATVEERARRRFIDNEQRGIASTVEELQRAIEERDRQDSEREASPLIQAPDAIFLDTTHLTIEEAANEILTLAYDKMV